MSHSLNEIEALAKRAARGAGLSWGLADEAAKCTRWLASFALPGPEMLAQLLDLNEHVRTVDVTPVSLTGVWSSPADRLCPVIAGASLNDYAMQLQSGTDIIMQNVSQPLLVVPFAAGTASNQGAPVKIQWNGVSLITNGNELFVNGSQSFLSDAATATLRCSAGAEMTGKVINRVMRGQIESSCWNHLSRFAQRTYAPATEESRLRGAGAGLSDND